MSGWAAVGQIVGNIGGNILDYHLNRRMAKESYQRSKEFAQNGISWKVADAKRAGIHPLYALGASTQSFSSNVGAGTNFAGGLERGGQAIGAEIDKRQDPNTKRIIDAGVRKAEAEAALVEKQGQVLDMELAGNQYELSNKGVVGQSYMHGNIEYVEPNVYQPTPISTKTGEGIQAGATPMYRWMEKDSHDGTRYSLSFSKDAEELADSDIAMKVKDYWGRIKNYVKQYGATPKILAYLRRQRNSLPKPKKGYYYVYDRFNGDFVEIKQSGKKRFYLDTYTPLSRETPY